MDATWKFSVQVPAVGITSFSNCTQTTSQVSALQNTTSLSVVFFTDSGCRGNVVIDAASAEEQSGVVVAEAATCGLDSATASEFLPVLFWFFQKGETGSEQNVSYAAMCQPSIVIEGVSTTWSPSSVDVILSANHANGGVYLTAVDYLPMQIAHNNVSGPPLDGRAYNG